MTKLKSKSRNDKKDTHRLFTFALIFGCLCVAIVMRASNYIFVFTTWTGHLNFIDTDCYYYLRRLVHFLSHFPSVMIFDPLADWPHGSGVDWMEGFLFIIGIPLKIFGVHSFRALELGASLMIILLGLTCIICIYLAGRRLLQDRALSTLVLFFASINFLLIRFSCLGELDHHILEATFPPLVLWLSLLSFQDKNWKAVIALGIVLAYSLTISSSSLFMIGGFYAVYAFVLGEKTNGKQYWIINAIFFFSILPYGIWNTLVREGPKSITHTSAFHLCLIATLCIASFVASRQRRNLKYILPAMIAMSGIAIFIGEPQVLIQPLTAGFTYVLGGTGGSVLSNISEAAPIYLNYGKLQFDFINVNFGYLVYLMPLAYILLIFFYKRWSRAEQAFLLMLALIEIPGIRQKRFAHILVGLFLIFVVWLLQLSLELCKRYEIKLRTALILFVLGLMILPSFQYGFSPRPSPRDHVDQGTAQLFLSRLNLDEKTVWNRLALTEPVTRGIWCDPNAGHLLNYLTGYGVVTNSFYHDNGFDLDFKLRKVEDSQSFKDILRENKIGYLIIADEWKFLELQYRIHGESAASFTAKKMVSGAESDVIHLDVLQKFAWVRLLMNPPDDKAFHHLFTVNFNEPYFYHFIRAYELDMKDAVASPPLKKKNKKTKV